ncbi:MAG: hypothetical protein WC654_01850 [Patescibacteria group bacterium]
MLKLPTREGSAPRSAPRPQRPSVPTVSKAEVELAVELLTGMYAPLAPHAEALLAFALESRQSAHAIVQISWVIAKIELTAGSETWYHREWKPAIAEAKSGEAMDTKTPEGRPVRLGRGERDVLIATISPIFKAPEGNLEAEKAVASTVIGKFGSAIRTSLRIIELVAGEEGYTSFKVQLEEARRDEAAAIAAGTAKPDVEAADEGTEAEGEQVEAN